MVIVISEFKLYLYGIEIANVKLVIIGIISSNCTFMELKLRVLRLLIILRWRSNCTFMELK